MQGWGDPSDRFRGEPGRARRTEAQIGSLAERLRSSLEQKYTVLIKVPFFPRTCSVLVKYRRLKSLIEKLKQLQKYKS